MNKEIEHIWSQFHKELKYFILGKVGNPTDADDILQDSFIKIIQNMDKVNEAQNMRQYLYGIVRNSTIDHFRKRKVINGEIKEEMTITEAEEESLNGAIAASCIKPFIENLPEKYKEALLITEFQDVSQKELAQQLGISYSGAKSRVQRGKEKLKDLLLDCCSFECDSYGNISDMKPKKCC